MSGYFDLDLGDWGDFSKKLNRKVTSGELERMFFAMMEDIADKSLAIVKLRTPVGVYPPSRNRVGGTLRREWKISEVIKRGNEYHFVLYNNTYYADWVENGHRTVNGGWVEGQFMLELSLLDISREMIPTADKIVSQFMGDL